MVQGTHLLVSDMFAINIRFARGGRGTIARLLADLHQCFPSLAPSPELAPRNEPPMHSLVASQLPRYCAVLDLSKQGNTACLLRHGQALT